MESGVGVDELGSGVGIGGLELGGVGGVGVWGWSQGGWNWKVGVGGDCMGSGGCSWFEITLKVL